MCVKASRGGLIGLCLTGVLLLWPSGGHSSHESFASYEDWTSGMIRSDRWLGFERFGGQEVKREVSGRFLHMRLRRQGGTGSDLSLTSPDFASNQLNLANPVSVDQLKVEFNVRSLTVTGCPANTTPSKARVAVIELGRFNDGSSTGPGDQTGDYFGVLQAVRRSNSPDPAGTLVIEFSITRCSDPLCSVVTDVGSAVLSERVRVGKKFTLTLVWDSPNNQFIARVSTAANPGSDVFLAYAPAANVGPAVWQSQTFYSAIVPPTAPWGPPKWTA